MYAPKFFTTVTSLSKVLAILLFCVFVMLPFLGLYFGYKYGLNTATLQCNIERNVLKNPTLISETKINITKSETDGWKVYRNETMGLQFEYPKTWTLTEEDNRVSLASPETRKWADKLIYCPRPTDWSQEGDSYRDIYFDFNPDINQVLDYYDVESIEDLYVVGEYGINPAGVFDIEQIQIGDITAKEFSVSGHGSTYGIHAVKGNHFYDFHFTNTWSKDKLGSIEKQIISTIKIF